MKTIPLTQGKVALVDDDLYPYLIMNKWCAHRNRNIWYAKTHVKGVNRSILMHNVIFQVRPGFRPDHRDGNGLNNQLSNLREATHSQNVTNSPGSQHRSNRMKGVYFKKGSPKNPWCAQIGKNRHKIYIGIFSSQESAARAYDEAAIKHFGEFARTNKMMGLIS